MASARARVWRDFEEALPRILGALFDAVGCALRNLEGVRLEEYPRMADFAAWVTAAEEALGWEQEAFMDAYADNRRRVSEAVLENDVVAAALSDLPRLREGGAWSGTAQELLDALNARASEETKRSRAWPTAANHLSRHLNRIAPALEEAGIAYSQHEEGRDRKRIKTLRRMDTTPGAGDRRGAHEIPSGPDMVGPGAAEDEGEAAEGGAGDGSDFAF